MKTELHELILRRLFLLILSGGPSEPCLPMAETLGLVTPEDSYFLHRITTLPDLPDCPNLELIFERLPVIGTLCGLHCNAEGSPLA